MVDSRDYTFGLDRGLHMSDGGRKIDFVESKNTAETVSVDDLLGSTLEVATQPIDPSDDYCQPVISRDTEWITFAGLAVTLPGWRQMFIDRSRFTSVDPSKEWNEWVRYRFTIPEDKQEFERLLRDEQRGR